VKRREAMEKIRWLFFDIGSTLADETEAYNHRIRDAIEGTDITFEEFCEKRVYFAKQNLKSDIETIKYFGLTKSPWHKEDEILYPDAKDVLDTMSERGYRLGVIANQSLGTADRLRSWGIADYFGVIMASAEEGIAKPSPEIFLRAFEKAGCSAKNAAMIGDRLDNDITPAKALGMMTVWVKQGYSSYSSPRGENETPDFTIDGIAELKDIFKGENT